MDPEAIAGMIFTLLIVGMIGGFILIYPLSKKLAALLENKLQPGPVPQPGSEQDFAQLRDQVAGLEQQVKRLADRQEFTEQLIAERHTPAISTPKSGSAV